jgi:NAD-dependent DNA ligase
VSYLSAEVAAARQAYYNQQTQGFEGSPNAGDQLKYTDDEYDALEDELRELDPGNSLFQEVGVAPALGSIWPKKQHRIAMGSLNKVKGVEGIREWFSKIARAQR